MSINYCKQFWPKLESRGCSSTLIECSTRLRGGNRLAICIRFWVFIIFPPFPLGYFSATWLELPFSSRFCIRRFGDLHAAVAVESLRTHVKCQVAGISSELGLDGLSTECSCGWLSCLFLFPSCLDLLFTFNEASDRLSLGFACLTYCLIDPPAWRLTSFLGSEENQISLWPKCPKLVAFY